ncbi:MAG TPA: protein kinase [Anaeromyxobacteraceae bacterium]|nr:protein kinase [Anaeromyxobacteraceae bacterium]
MADQPDLSKLAGMKLGNYRLERLLGRGRMGAVYLAQDEALLRPTAIKILSWSVAAAHGQDPVQWFLAEARLVARINHPRVVQIYGAAKQGGFCYIAMEYVAGQSAEAVIAKVGPMAPETATDILVQTASALHAAHRSGVVHRDVKPANLLIGVGGIAKLGDFGMALGSAELRIGTAHLRVGTPYYTAPEIWRGEPASAAADIYSLGATYFQLLTGRPPYPEPDSAAVEHAHLRAPVPDPRDLAPRLPPSCASLVRRALAKAPKARHATAQELIWDARRVLQDLAPTSAPRRAKTTAEAATLLARPADPLVETLGLVRRPFLGVEAIVGVFQVEPFKTLRSKLLDCVERGEATVFALVGEEGSGRTALCRITAADLGRSRRVVLVDLAREASAGNILQRVCQAAGADEGSSEQENLAALVEVFGKEHRKRKRPPLVVLDGCAARYASAPGLDALIEAALWTRSFRVFLVGEPGLTEVLARSVDFGDERSPEIAIPPLNLEQISRYVRCCLEGALAPGAKPIIFSTDALLLLGLRSGGTLGRINRIAENMLKLAAAERCQTLSSWHAWAAEDREDLAFHGDRAMPRRPEPWPTPEVVDVIDTCRRGAGIPPWPKRSRSAGNAGGDQLGLQKDDF